MKMMVLVASDDHCWATPLVPDFAVIVVSVGWTGIFSHLQ